MKQNINTLKNLSNLLDYSFLNTLKCDKNVKLDGKDYNPRQIKNGHYTLVKPTPIPNPIYIAHSKTFFDELGFCNSLAKQKDFMQLFTGNTSNLEEPFSKNGWATGYALSIYGTEYYEQCPFRTGNGYGDGRALSILEILVNNKRWEMQLKGAGKTPYCRGADGRAVLRSSVREFLAQEHMYALGIPTSRSLSLYTSYDEKVLRPWFLNNSYSKDPEVMIEEDIAICTRVAPSFIRVGQIELFGRRARKKEHKYSKEELEQIVLHLITREYKDDIDVDLSKEDKIIALANEYKNRLTYLVANWIRVGYCQGNFNSDNCAAGGYTLDYGPFGFIDMFDTQYQPWTGGGVHYSFLNQQYAAKLNFDMFCNALKPLLNDNSYKLQQLKYIQSDFEKLMEEKMIKMWASKLGFDKLDAHIFNDLISLMVETSVDYTIFFRELSNIPDDISLLKKSFYDENGLNKDLLTKWEQWLNRWKQYINNTNSNDYNAKSKESKENLSLKMKQINPKYTLREWILVPAYKQAQNGDYSLIHEIQDIMINPYKELSKEIEDKYYKKKPDELFHIAGISHISCSS